MTTNMSDPNPLVETAVPTLKVMRLQKPDLHMPTAGTLQAHSILGAAMCLPDSFGVIHVGETFTAYLGALNVSKVLKVSRLTVTAQLQTPSQRWHLASRLDEKNETGGVEVPPESGVDAIVSHVVEEAGQHILRVEIGYMSGDGSVKTLRKFYRFQVSNPLIINAATFRSSDSCCFVAISLENDKNESKGGLTICQAEFEATEGLTADRVPKKTQNPYGGGTCMYDSCGHLEAGQTFRYLFRVSIEPKSITRGIAAGDELGKAFFSWRKSGGEFGRLASAPIFSPSLSPFPDPDRLDGTSKGRENPFVVHCKGKSGLSVDIASAAARRLTNPVVERNALDQALPVTVEPINPPVRMELGVPTKVEFLIINHSDREMVVQLQFRLDHTKGIAVCGTSFINLQEIHGRGGSAKAIVSFVPLACGHLRIDGCTVVDMIRGISIPQPPLSEVVVERRQLNQ